VDNMKFVDIMLTTKDEKHICKGWYSEVTNIGQCESYELSSEDEILKIEIEDNSELNLKILNRFTDFHSLCEVIKWQIK